MKEIAKLKKISEEELKEAQDYIGRQHLLEMEDTQKIADQLLFWEQVKNAEEMERYLKKIKRVRVADVRRVVDKYLKYYAEVVLEAGSKR